MFGNDADAAIEAKIEALYRKYRSDGQASAALDRCNELEIALASRIGALAGENQRYFALRALAELNFPGAVTAVRSANAQLAESVEPLIAERLAVLQTAHALAPARSTSRARSATARWPSRVGLRAVEQDRGIGIKPEWTKRKGRRHP